MPKRSAGLVLYRRKQTGYEVLLVHPGGPFWAKRDLGAWSIPKGEYADGEEPYAAARREFAEELGTEAPTGPCLDLGEAVQKSHKVVRAFAVEGDLDPLEIRSNTIEITWPPRTGRTLTISEIDRAEWFGVEEAAARILDAQRVLLDRLGAALAAGVRQHT